METDSIVYVVDDDETVRRSLRWLIESVRLAVQTFASGEEFLENYDPLRPACLILDIRMDGMSGLEVQETLNHKDFKLPIIVMTGHGDIAACKRAFKLGAFDFLEKPTAEKVLIDLIRDALAADKKRRQWDQSHSQWVARMDDLTPRESEVMNLIVKGHSQKQIAAMFDISFQTVAKHRAKVLAKLGVRNDIELVRLVLDATRPT